MVFRWLDGIDFGCWIMETEAGRLLSEPPNPKWPGPSIARNFRKFAATTFIYKSRPDPFYMECTGI